jgi:ferredoxin
VTARSARLRVDPVACTASGLCAGWLPERIVLDEWGYPVLDRTPLPAELVRHAKRAARECPVRALRLVVDR